MKYSSKITENRVCKDWINWKQTEQACDWTERKATIKIVLKQNQYIWTEINVNKVVTCTGCGFF